MRKFQEVKNNDSCDERICNKQFWKAVSEAGGKICLCMEYGIVFPELRQNRKGWFQWVDFLESRVRLGTL